MVIHKLSSMTISLQVDCEGIMNTRDIEARGGQTDKITEENR
jgi:hypothetical protein